MNARTSERDISFDMLRSIAIVCIVVAHTNVSGMLRELRNFDVPLLIAVAGSVFIGSYARSRPSYGRYVVARIVRLLAPTWAFLLIFFLSSYALFQIVGKPWPFSISTVVASAALLEGIGYVWVIRAFVLVALVAPLLARLHRRIRSDLLYYGILAGVYFVYEAMHLVYPASGSGAVHDLVGLYLYYVIPYGCIFGLGIRMRSSSQPRLVLMSAVFLAVFAASLIYLRSTGGLIRPTQTFKYPPGVPYVAYAMAVSCILYALFSSYRSHGTRFERLITFVGSSTLWIYLWHIYAVFLLTWIGEPGGSAGFAYGIQGIALLVPAVLVTFVQKKLVSRICAHPRVGEPARKTLNIIFLK